MVHVVQIVHVMADVRYTAVNSVHGYEKTVMRLCGDAIGTIVLGAHALCTNEHASGVHDTWIMVIGAALRDFGQVAYSTAHNCLHDGRVVSSCSTVPYCTKVANCH